jgi:hypothetical protein
MSYFIHVIVTSAQKRIAVTRNIEAASPYDPSYILFVGIQCKTSAFRYRSHRTFTLMMATVIFAEKFDNSQYSTRIINESRSFTFVFKLRFILTGQFQERNVYI